MGLHTSRHTRKNSSFSTQDQRIVLLGLEALPYASHLHYATRSKYLIGLCIFVHVSIVKAGFESQLRAAHVPITFGMRALGMTSQIRDGRLYRGIEPRHVPDLQGLDNPASGVYSTHRY